MNLLRKTCRLMTVGILTAVLTTAPVNADAAGRESAEERNRLAGIPTCNAAGTANMDLGEALAHVSGKPVPKDSEDINVCNDDGVLRIVPPPMRVAGYPEILEFDKKLFKYEMWSSCMIRSDSQMVLSFETAHKNKAANRKQAISQAETIKASPQFQYVVNYVNTTYGENTVSGDIVTLMWVGPEDMLRYNGRPSHQICSLSTPELWDSTARPQEIAAAVHKIIEDYLDELSRKDLITLEEKMRLSDKLEQIPAL